MDYLIHIDRICLELSILYFKGSQACVVSKEPAQTCNGCEGNSRRGGCSAASSPCVRHDD